MQSALTDTNWTRFVRMLNVLDILDFDEAAAPHYAVIRAGLEKNRLVIGERDMQIAAIARARKLTVVTHNTREFDRIPGLKVEDWAT